MSTRIGPRQREIAAIVSARPGISKRAALLAAGLPVSGINRDAPVHRTIRAGLIIAEHERCNLTRLYATERDRERFRLRAELLTPGTPAERIAEIAAEIARLDAERAASWTASA